MIPLLTAALPPKAVTRTTALIDRFRSEPISPAVLLAYWEALALLHQTSGVLAVMLAAVTLDNLPPVQLPQLDAVGACHAVVSAIVRDEYPKKRYERWLAGDWDGCAPDTGLRPPHFALKTHPGAVDKVNIKYPIIKHALGKVSDRCYRALMDWEASGRGAMLYEDQATALVLYAHVLEGVVPRPWELAETLILSEPIAKDLTNLLKGLGLNGTLQGAMLCEANTLRGRAVGTVDLDAEIESRATDRLLHCFNPDPVTLREAIKSVLEEELPNPAIQWEDVDAFWARRAAFTANGAHHDHRYKLAAVPGIRNTRRSAMEQLEENVIDAWDGTCRYSASLKLEHGKTRALFSADTSSYYAFAHLLAPCEAAWRNYRVVLDPGAGGTAGMVNRIKAAGDSVHVMLDYTDFNSQHSNASQAAVIDELCRHTNYPRDLASKLVQSFSRGVVMRRLPDGRSTPVPIVGTLMSGHRATSFINSVLNRAYLLCAYPGFDRLHSIHVGDDVYVGVRDYGAAAALVAAVHASGIKINPVKQSIGTRVAEFLRTATSGAQSFMYVARCVSSIVSGNWISAHKLDPAEALTSFNRTAWALENRSGLRGKAAILAWPIAAVTRLSPRDAMAVAMGRVAVAGGPVRYRDEDVHTLALRPAALQARAEGPESDPTDIRYTEVVPPAGRHATMDYIQKAANDLDRTAVAVCNAVPVEAMLKASYAKAFASSRSAPEQTYVLTRRVYIARADQPRPLEVAMRDHAEGPNRLDGAFIATMLVPMMSQRQVAEFKARTGLTDVEVDKFRRAQDVLPPLALGPIGYGDASSVDTSRIGMVPLYSTHKYFV